jgi:hypothetical protein
VSHVSYASIYESRLLYIYILVMSLTRLHMSYVSYTSINESCLLHVYIWVMSLIHSYMSPVYYTSIYTHTHTRCINPNILHIPNTARHARPAGPHPRHVLRTCRVCSVTARGVWETAWGVTATCASKAAASKAASSTLACCESIRRTCGLAKRDKRKNVPPPKKCFY